MNANTLATLLNVIQIILGLGSIAGFLYGGFIWIIRPIRNLVTGIKANTAKFDRMIDMLDNRVIPFIDSMTHEFSPNSGKSIKDQINRIDDATRLAELRSKLIASNLLTSTGVYECNVHGDCTWANNAFCDMLGLSQEEVLGSGWLAGIKAADRIKVWEVWQQSIAQDIPYECLYTIVNHRTREEISVRANAITHKSISGKNLGFYGTLVRV